MTVLARTVQSSAPVASGTATLATGAVTVSAPLVTASSIIEVLAVGAVTTGQYFNVTSISAGVSFTISSSDTLACDLMVRADR